MGKRLKDAIGMATIVWVFGGGFAVSLLVLAVFNWRAALVTFAVWIISLLYAIFWMITTSK